VQPNAIVQNRENSSFATPSFKNSDNIEMVTRMINTVEFFILLLFNFGYLNGYTTVAFVVLCRIFHQATCEQVL